MAFRSALSGCPVVPQVFSPRNMATPAPNIEAQVYTKLWVLLLANDNWVSLIPAGNQIRYDAEEGSNDPDKLNESDGDFPKAELMGPISGDDLLRTTDQTFGTLDVANSPYSEKQLLNFELVLTSETLDIREVLQIGAESRDAIRQGGARLGLEFVTSVRLRWTTRKEPNTENDSLPRWRQRLSIIVQTETDNANLQGTN